MWFVGGVVAARLGPCILGGIVGKWWTNVRSPGGPVGYEVWGLVVGPDGKIRWGDRWDDLVTRNFPAAWRRSLPVGGDFVGWLVWSFVLGDGG